MAKDTGLDINKLFRDKKNYADDLVIDLGNGASMSLGDLRAYNDAMGGDLKKQMQAEKQLLEAERGKVNKAAEEVANLYLQLEEKQKTLGNQPINRGKDDDPFATLEGDPLAKVLKGFMDEVRGELKSTRSDLEKVGKNLTQAGRTYMNDLVRNQYDSLRKDPDFSEDMTLDGVFDYAVKRGLKREDGIPDVREAYDRMIQPKRQERLIKEAKAEARKELELEQQKAAFMPPPGSFGQHIGPRDSMKGDPKQPPRTIREAVARGASDPSIFGFKDSVQ
jgi:hypothetical protein